MKKTLASLISFSLIVLSPGLPAYASAGNVLGSRAVGAGPALNVAAPTARNLSISPSLPSLRPVLNPSFSLNNTAGAPVNAAASAQPAAVGFAASPAAASAPNSAASAVLPGVAAAAAAQASPATALATLGQKAELSLSAEQAAAMPAGAVHETGRSIIDRLTGARPQARDGQSSVDAGTFSSIFKALSPFGGDSRGGSSYKPPVPPSSRPTANGQGNGPRRSKILGFLGVGARVVAGAAIVLGLQAAGVALLPAIFGVVPVAAVWAVSSGILLFPAAIYARYRLSLRDSPRLKKVKWLLDGVIGAYAGAVLVAVPAFSVVLAAQGASIGLPVAAAAGAGSVISLMSGARLVDMLLTGAALATLPVLLGVGGAGLIGLAPILGMMALPAMTTIAFFLGQIINSAETGRPFSVPGSMQKIRFPAFNWVMIGVVFALTTGFSAVHANLAFMAWTFFGNKGKPTWNKSLPAWKNILGFILNFNVLYLGLLAFTAATGFASPLTFLVIAFAPERAANWTESLLGRFLPASEAAPSTKPAPAVSSLSERIERKWPAFHHWAKTGILLGTMAAMGVAMGATVFGFASLLKNLAVAAVLAAIPFFFSTKLVKAVMRAEPTDAQKDPEFFEIMTELREKINAKLTQAGKKPIPMPEMVNVPMEAPNAFATGRDPSHALVGVTVGIKEMLLDPEGLRDGLVRLMASVEPQGKPYKVFRIAMAGTISGVTNASSPEEAAQAISRADPAELKKLGVRLLRGVLGHEFSHVMDRHMLTGSIGGAISSGVAFASYGVMWAVGHAQAIAVRLKDRLLGRAPKLGDEPQSPGGKASGARGGSARPEALEPLSTGVVLKSLPALLRVFAALWGPVILQITQMAGSRNNEGQADEDGALLTGDPAALALALGMLTTWRPRAGVIISNRELPRLAAVAHMMTVNPLQQLHEAGAIPKADSALEWAVGKSDNFMLDLFLTHPDTRLRIENLLRMSESLGQDQDSQDGRQPPPGGGGAQAPPLALGPTPQTNAPAESRGVSFSRGGAGRGVLRRAWDRVFRVLPDERRNREFWKFTWGQALMNIGGNFHYSALAKLLAPKPELSSRVTDNRAISSAAQLISSLATGPAVDRMSVRKVLVWTNLGRAVMMMAVPVLFFHGYFALAAFHLLIFAAGFLQSTGMTAGAVAFNRILGEDEAYYNKANAVFNTVLSAVGILAPLAAGAFILAMDARFGLLAGNALSYGVYGLLLLASGVLYMTLRVPNDAPAKQDLQSRPAPKGIGDRVRELLDGFKLIWRSRFLRLYLVFTTFSVMMADPIVFSALPRYISDVLVSPAPRQGAIFGLYLAGASLGTGISSVAMMLLRDRSASDLEALLAAHEAALPGSGEAVRHALGQVLARYREGFRADPAFNPQGRLAADLAAEAASRLKAPLSPALLEGLESWARRHEARLARQAKREAAGKLSPLESQGRWSSILHGLGWLMYLGIFFSHSLPVSIGFMVAAMLLSGPAMSVWSSLLQKVIADETPEAMGKVYASLFFYQLAFSIAGSLLFGWAMMHFSTLMALKLAGGVMVFMALLDFLEPYLIFPLTKK